MREIVCDESGYEGEKFIDTTTDVFAHASLSIEERAAADCLAELRRRIRSPAVQYKSGHLLREKNRRTLVWFLGAESPVYARGHVYLIDKAYFVLTKLAALFPLNAECLFASGPARYGPDRWATFLSTANDLLRGKDQPAVVDEFLRMAPGYLTDGLLAGARARADLFRAWLRQDPVTNSVLDPLVPAIVAAVAHWGPVTITHDRQTQLPAARVALLIDLCGGALAGMRFLDAESHPQIQLADILAGTIRKIASDHRNGRGDPVLTTLARPYVDRSSVWSRHSPSLGG